MTTYPIFTVTNLASTAGVNTHWNFSPTWYKSGATQTGSAANPAVISLMLDAGWTVWRQRLSGTNPTELSAMSALSPQYRVIGAVGDMASSKTEVQTTISNLAALCRTAGRTFVYAVLCPNEPNAHGGGTWPGHVKTFAGWCREALDGETWPSGVKPLLGGPGLKHNGVPYDDDITAMAAQHLEVECDIGDFHCYDGSPGPGVRVTGNDDNGNLVAGLTFGTDSKVSKAQYELFRARRIYNSTSFPMFHSEFGWTTDQTINATAANDVVESYLRWYQLGVAASTIYEAIDEWPYALKDNGDPDPAEGQFGAYVVNPAGSPANSPGAKPIYNSIRTLLTYSGSADFSVIGSLVDIGSTVPDCGRFAFSRNDGTFDLYLTKEVETTIRLVLDPAWAVEGGTLSSGHYDLTISGTWSKFHIVQTGAAGGANLGGEGTLTLSATYGVLGSVAFSSEGLLIPTGGGINYFDTAALGGGGTQTLVGVPKFSDGGVLGGGGQLTLAGVSSQDGFSSTGGGTLTLFGRINYTGTCALGATGLLTGTAGGGSSAEGGSTTFGVNFALDACSGQADITGGIGVGEGFNISYVASGENSSYRFFGPTTQENLAKKGIWSWYSLPKGLSVLRSTITHRFELHPYPTMDQLNAAGREGVDYFLGGRDYEVGRAIAAELVESGFSVTGFQGFGITWAGDALQDEVYVSTFSDGLSSVGVGFWRSDQTVEDAILLDPVAPNTHGWAKFHITDLVPDTTYYHQTYDGISGGFVGTANKLKTLRPPGDLGSGITKIAPFCCKQSPLGNQAAFVDMASWVPDRTIDLGDMGYPDYLSTDITTHMDNWSEQLRDPGMQIVMALGCNDYIISDHDDNGSGKSNLPPGDDGGITLANLEAWQEVVPARFEATDGRDRGRFVEIEGHVAFFKPDTRSPDRTDPSNKHDHKNPHNPDSKMLGDAQLGRLLDGIDAAVTAGCAVGVFYTDPAWAGTSDNPIPVSEGDKWPSFIYQRDQIGGYAAGNAYVGGTYSGRVPLGILPLFVVHGDDHALKQDDGTSDTHGHASIGVGPVWQNLHSKYLDQVQWSYPTGADGDSDSGDHSSQRNAAHYQRLTIYDNVDTDVSDLGEVVIVAEARDCTPPTTPGKPKNIPANTPLTVHTLTKHYRYDGGLGAIFAPDWIEV